MDVTEWLSEFLRRHRMRYRPFDFPEPGTEEELVYAQMWLRVFEENRVDYDEADAASDGLAETPPRYRSDHIPAVMKAIRKAREERANRAAIVEEGMRIYTPAYVAPPEEPLRWPEGVRKGDVKALWRHLAERNGTPNIRRVEPERKSS